MNGPTKDAGVAEADAEVARLMALTDDEVVAEVVAEGGDPVALADEVRAVAARAIANHDAGVERIARWLCEFAQLPADDVISDGGHTTLDWVMGYDVPKLLALLPHPAPKEMTGFLALLTEEQRAAALAYTGDDTVGPLIGAVDPAAEEVAGRLEDEAVKDEADALERAKNWESWRRAFEARVVAIGPSPGADPHAERLEGRAKSLHQAATLIRSQSARIAELEWALKGVQSDLQMTKRAIEEKDPYNELRVRTADTLAVVDAALSPLCTDETRDRREVGR